MCYDSNMISYVSLSGTGRAENVDSDQGIESNYLEGQDVMSSPDITKTFERRI